MTSSFRVVAAGDASVVVEFENRIDPDVNARAVALAESIEADSIAGVRDVVATYRSVAVYFDPLKSDYETLVATLNDRAASTASATRTEEAPVRIPVCYGGACGPDLGEVARFAGVSEAAAVDLHLRQRYRVYMLGFLPGFAYLGIVDDRIAAPRRATPRLRVPAGSVGIAGAQTGIYPLETPGGWQLVGRSPVKPFDVGRSNPFLLKTGDSVEFYGITHDEHERWPSA